MGVNLLICTILIRLVTGTIASTFWLSYTLLLILLGGLLVIFIYVALLARNEKFSFTGVTTRTIAVGGGVVICISRSDTKSAYKLIDTDLYVSLTKLFSESLYQITLFLVVYLLITIVVVVFNTKAEQVPLRLYI